MLLNPAVRRQRQADLSKFEASLIYRVSSRTDSKITEKPCLNKQTNIYKAKIIPNYKPSDLYPALKMTRLDIESLSQLSTEKHTRPIFTDQICVLGIQHKKFITGYNKIPFSPSRQSVGVLRVYLQLLEI